MTTLAALVAASSAVAATRSRREKGRVLEALLREVLAGGSPEDAAVVTAYLAGDVRQRATGVGWSSLRALPAPAERSSLDVLDVDAAVEALSTERGPGSAGRRADRLGSLLSAATAEEQDLLRRLLLGELRQGALEAQVLEAWAAAADAPLEEVRRAAMLSGSLPAVAALLVARGPGALAEVGLVPGRGVHPMLAASSPSVGEALAGMEHGASVEEKIDGIRVQVHRDGDEVVVLSRTLDDLTGRLPEVVALARALPVERVVLDGEAVALRDDGRPHAFQDTASRTGTRTPGGGDRALTPVFFDLLHLDGRDLLGVPLEERRAELERVVPEEHRVRALRWLPGQPVDAAEGFLAATLARGHEGVVVKDLASAYSAGRRGSAWVKVKPVHTLDLLVLGAEWGSGRRRGWLSNLHLGARDPDGGAPVMLGKTFKGLTDALLEWQTAALQERAVERPGWGVVVRPDLVVEIAFDGVQRSPRYPGGVALRFARVVRYREDKQAAEADDLAAVRAHLPG
ncbi:ATP-dependent DNA ligase [Motilibacter rhizosphaerae]|nr:ATP-dependent DNA ligase [Motilibacter rhizosphaerae]